MTVCSLARRRILKCVSAFAHFGAKSLTDVQVHYLSLISQRNSHLSHTIKETWSVLFFGSDEFALDSLRALHNQYRLQKLLCRLEVVTAYKGKENCLTKYAKDNGITVHQWPVKVNNTEFHIGVVVSFGHLIPSHIINSFPLGMINVHASLLPRWRGSAPIIYTLMHGDTKTGVSIMKIMPKKFDIGEVITQEETTVGPDETQPELYAKLAKMGSKLLIKTMEKLPEVLSTGVRQKEESVTHAPKIKADISFVKWKEMTAKNVYDLKRALIGLYPLRTYFNDQAVKLSEIEVFSDSSNVIPAEDVEPGTVIYHKQSNSLIVRCKENTWLSVKRIGLSGRPQMSALDFKNGFMGSQRRKSCNFSS